MNKLLMGTCLTMAMQVGHSQTLPQLGKDPIEKIVAAMNTYGADSFVGRLSSIVQGSCDTTFYVVALYYGSVGIRNTRYTVQCALLADLAGAIAAIAMAYLFF